jgi:hypothetical protein
LVVYVTSLTFPPKKPSCSGNCSKPKTYSSQKPPYKRQTRGNHKQFQSKPEQTYYKKTYKKFTKSHKPFQSKPKPKFDLKNITCYKCNQKGHTSRFCKINSKLHELQIDEDTINQIQNLYIEATDTDPSLSDNSEEEFQIDEIVTSSATSDTSTDSKQVNVLTQDQEFILEAIKRLDDSQLQKTYLDKLLKDFSKPEHLPSNPPNRSVVPSTSTNTYDLTKILNKRKSKTTVTVSELHSEIKTLKFELQSLKQAQQKDSAILQHLLSKIESEFDTESEPDDQTIEPHTLPHALTNIEHILDDFLNVLTQISSKKYLIKITLVFSDDFKLDTIALFDTGADLNCIKEGVVPKRFLQNTSEKLSAANNFKLHIAGKTQASVSNKCISLKTFFVVTKDINHTIILGTPFIDMITPYKAHHDCITSKINNIKLVFPFLEKSKTRNLNLIKACTIHTYHINALIHGKQFQLHDLQNHVSFCRIEKKLQNSVLKTKIIDLQNKIEQQICSDLPNAFWERKQHIVDLPYEDTFLEKTNTYKSKTYTDEC